MSYAFVSGAFLVELPVIVLYLANLNDILMHCSKGDNYTDKIFHNAHVWPSNDLELYISSNKRKQSSVGFFFYKSITAEYDKYDVL